MIESADELPLAGFRQSAQAASLAPSLPDGGKFLVGAVHASQQLQNVAAQLQTLLTHAPGDRTLFDALIARASDEIWALASNFDAAHAVRECRGQG